MPADKRRPPGRLLAHDDALRLMQQYAGQRAESRGTGSDNQHRVVGLDFGNTRRPISRGENIAHEQSLLIAHPIGNTVESAVGRRHTHILGLTTVDAAAECPTAVGVGAIIYIASPAEKTFAAEGLHVHGDTVARLDGTHLGTHLLDDSDHLMADDNTWHGTRHTAVLDVQIARANTAQCYSHHGIACIDDLGHRPLLQLKPPRCYIYISQHKSSFFSLSTNLQKYGQPTANPIEKFFYIRNNPLGEYLATPHENNRPKT